MIAKYYLEIRTNRCTAVHLRCGNPVTVNSTDFTYAMIV